MTQKVLQIHKNDNVLVALQDIAAGELLYNNGNTYQTTQAIPAKHKFFTRAMDVGEAVIMYGVLVGRTQCPVALGELVSVQTVQHAAEAYSYRNSDFEWKPPDVSKWANATFNGYHRSDGRVGTANYWLFIPTVFCENGNLDTIREALYDSLGYSATAKYKRFTQDLVKAYENGSAADEIDLSATATNSRLFKNVDGIKFLTHQGGCGGIRQDAAVLSKLLAAYADHPNVGGVTVLSLGCQNLQLTDFLNDLKDRAPLFDKPLYIFEQQQWGSEEGMITASIRKTFEGLKEINTQTRQAATLDKLCVGVKCGGSDGFSGISANPAVGYCSDLLVALGARVLLAEFPELCGVEQEIVDRAVDEPTARRFMQLMKSYETLVTRAGSGFHMNPSPGNIKDGLVTDAMKSAGAAKKGGTSPIVAVLDYTEPASKNGLSLVCTPGNDVEATTGKAASGATLILFTTGLGTPTGNPVCPTIKIASNSKLASRMNDIIDLNTGGVIEGIQTIEEAGEAILDYCIQVASGTAVPKAVQQNHDDFIPWKRGVSL